MKLSCSFDFELGWGTVENKNWITRSKQGVYNDLRIALPEFLKLLDDLEIPVTFACVGGMLQPETERDFSYLPNSYQRALQFFLEEAPESVIDARDLLDCILSKSVDHEVASHSYSHIHAKHPEANENILRKEIENSLNVFQKEYSLNASALIFPRDQVYPSDTYKDSDISVVRIPPDLSSLGQYGRYLALPKAEVSSDSKNVYAISGSYFLNWGVTNISLLKKILTQFKSQKLLKFSLDQNSDFHVWLHPFNLTHTPQLFEYLCDFFRKLAVLRDKNQCEILTMSDHALKLSKSAEMNI